MCVNEIEDEMHFLFKCPSLHHERVSLYREMPEILNYSDNVEKLKFLLQKPYILGKYLDKLWQTRTLLINQIV